MIEFRDEINGEIEINRKLAAAVIKMAIDDLTSNDPTVQRSAEQFCLSSDPAFQKRRQIWLGWLQIEEETLARVANKILAQRPERLAA